VASSSNRLAELKERLQRLHRHSGEPSLREVARRTGRAVSHTTVNQVLRGTGLPKWGPTELVVEALGGDPQEFRALWVAARDEQDEAGVAPSSHIDAHETEPPEVDAAGALALRNMSGSALERVIAENDKRAEKLSGELLVALEKRRELQEQLEKVISERDELFEQSRFLREQAQEERARRERLEAAADALTREVTQLNRQITTLQAELRQLREEQLEASELKVKRLERELAVERSRKHKQVKGPDRPVSADLWEPDPESIGGWLGSQDPRWRWRASVLGFAAAAAVLAAVVLAVLFATSHTGQ